MPRFAARITPEEFRAKLLADVIRLGTYSEAELRDFVRATRNSNPSISQQDRMISRAMFWAYGRLSSKIDKDLDKIKFDRENFEAHNDDHTHGLGYGDLCGINQLPNGLTFIGCAAGGDWEYPVFFIIYWDGKQYRAYIPEDGNIFNKTSRAAYGNGQEDSTDYDDIKKQLGDRFEEPEIDEEYPESKYEYDLLVDNFQKAFNREAIIADITERIQIR